MTGQGRIWLAALAGVACIAAASDPAERLPDPAKEAQARQIFREVRCLVCQNESIDDSDAPLAADLRRAVREQVLAGKDERQVKTFLTDRYGEFVLLKPSFSLGNLALWAAPFAVLLFGLLLLMGRLRSRAPEAELTPEEAAQVARLAEDAPADTIAPQK